MYVFRIIILTLLLCFCYSIQGQNLINNPSFENVTSEPFYGCEFPNAIGWLNPSGAPCPTNTGATPDLFSTLCTGQADLPNSFMAYINPHTGNRIAGLGTYNAQLPDFREYIMAQLNQPLILGHLYKVSFWTSGGTSTEYIYYSNNIEIYFSDTPLVQSGYSVISGITPQLSLTGIVANSAWTYYEFYYTPNTPASYLTLGNFKNDANTQLLAFGQNRPYAYYFFDDFEIIAVNDSVTTQVDTTICAGEPVILTAQGIFNGQCSWYIAGIPGTIIDNDSILNVTPTTTTTYVVQGSSSEDTIIVTVNPSPIFNLGNDTTICQGQSVTLNPGIAGATYLWNTGETTQTINVSSSSSYWLSVTQSACSWVDTINVSVLNPPLPFNLGNDTTICQGETVVLNTGILTTAWSSGVIDSTITVNATGTYCAVISNVCATESDTVNIIVNPLPVFSLGNDTTICQAQSVTLEPGIAGASYAWSTTEVTQVITVNTAGVYSLTVTQSGCRWADTINVTVLNPPQPFSLGNDSAICAGQTVTLSTGVGSTVWSTGITGSQIVVSASGIFVGTVSSICGTEADTIIVTVNLLPVVSLGNDIALCTGDVYMLDVTTSGTTYQWQDNSNSGTYTVVQQGTYSVTVTENGCPASDSIIIDYDYCNCYLTVPTAFSPNGDGLNDRYRPIYRCPIENFLMRIHNRGGEVVYETNDITEGWDGTYKNIPQPISTFVWYIQYTDPYTDKEVFMNGNVSLIR